MATHQGADASEGGPPRPEAGPVVVTVYGPILPADIPGLCRRVRAAMDAGDSRTVVCDVAPLHDPDAVAVDALARIQLTARRRGRRMVLRNVASRLRELLGFAGLCDSVLAERDSAREDLRQAERGEQPGGVHEGVHRDDPPA